MSATLDDARRAEHDYERRNELHAAAVPSAFFEARLLAHREEARLLLPNPNPCLTLTLAS